MATIPTPTFTGYAQTTQAQAIAALGERLDDPGNTYWSAAELRLYLAEAIRTWQAYTGWYRSSYNVPLKPSTIWYDIGTYTITDSQLISMVLYHLLEAQLVNNTWAGTGQFDLAIIQNVLRNRVDRFLGDTGVVSTHRVQGAVMGGRSGRVPLENSTIDVRRVAWASTGGSRVLWRSDEWGLNSFLRGWKQVLMPVSVPVSIAVNGTVVGIGTTINGTPIDVLGLSIISVNGGVAGGPTPGPSVPVTVTVNSHPVGSGVLVNGNPVDPLGLAAVAVNGTVIALPLPEPPVSPQVYSVAATPPVSIQLAPPPNIMGNLDLVVVMTGPDLALGPSILGIPDDLVWGVKWGVLADLLSRDGQAKDPARAVYSEQRYREAVELASLYPSIVQTTVNGVPIFTGSVFDMDSFSNGWQNAPPGVPTAAGLVGRNLLALSPMPINTVSVVLDMIVDIPVPNLDTDFIAVPPDVMPVILDYAQHLASFKMGGTEFAVTDQQRSNFLFEAANYNSRLRQTNFYNSTIRNLAVRNQEQVPRMDMVKANG